MSQLVSLPAAFFVVAAALWLWALVGTVRDPIERPAIRRVTIGLLAATPFIAFAGWWLVR